MSVLCGGYGRAICRHSICVVAFFRDCQRVVLEERFSTSRLRTQLAFFVVVMIDLLKNRGDDRKSEKKNNGNEGERIDTLRLLKYLKKNLNKKEVFVTS